MIRKKLSIIIPYHNEPEDIIYDLFNSLNNQINIDFNDIEIVISNNSLEPVKPDCFENFSNLNIKYIICPIKNGVGSSRQFALDNCCGNWCIFCDCDDKLYSSTTLSEILQDTENSNCDLIYYKELIEQNPNEYIEYGKNLVLVHGKAFNVDYLRLNNIRFNDYLLYGADVYFSLLIDGTLPNYKIIDRIIYIWKYNDKSVSHSNNFDTFTDKIDGIKRTYIVYNKIKKYYYPNILDLLMPDIFWAIYFGWKTVKEFYANKSEYFYLIGSQILALTIETLDPTHKCLEFNTSVENFDEFSNFVKDSQNICSKMPPDFIERNQLWI